MYITKGNKDKDKISKTKRREKLVNAQAGFMQGTI